MKVKLGNIEIEVSNLSKRKEINKLKDWLQFKDRTVKEVKDRLDLLNISYVNVEIL